MGVEDIFENEEFVVSWSLTLNNWVLYRTWGYNVEFVFQDSDRELLIDLAEGR